MSDQAQPTSRATSSGARRPPRTRSRAPRNEDGRGESVWDRFCATPGKVRNGDTGAVACDFYHRYRDDIGLMRELGIDAFRFSIAWPRVLPDGRGRVNAKGLDFYDRLVDELLANGIEPFVTLFHWDMPQALEDEGGWPARATVDAFAEYVEAVAGTARRPRRRTGSRTTSRGSSPGSATAGAITRRAARRDADALAAAHHLLLSHGRAVEILRRAVAGRRRSASRSTSTTRTPRATPPRTSPPRAGSTGYTTAGSSTRSSAARIPSDMLERVRARSCRRSQDGDLADDRRADRLPRRQQLHLAASSRPTPTAAARGSSTAPTSTDTDMGWEVVPRRAARPARARSTATTAPPAIYVTENGAAFGDVRGHDGSVHDPERAGVPRRRTSAAAARAIADGVPLRGYFVWSLLDNFEWALRLLEALRHRLRRLRDARAGAEGQLLLVPRLHRGDARAGGRSCRLTAASPRTP